MELWIHGNHLTSLPDSIRKVKHALLYSTRKEFKLMVKNAENRVEQRLKRRLVIMTAQIPTAGKAGRRAARQATKDKKVPLVYQVLLEPKLAKLIAEYMDYK